MKKYRNLLLIVVSFFAGAFTILVTGLAFAHGGDANLIHGCVRNNGLLAGFIRIVGANTNCNGNETALDWKQGLKDPPFSCPNCDLNQNGDDLSNRFVGKNFSNAFLQGAFIESVDLSETNFINAYLRNAVLDASNFSNSNLSNANLISTSFGYANLTNANFTGANLTNANIGITNLSNTNFTNANLINASLLGATNMNTATLTGVTWSNTTCPDGTNSDNNGGTCVGHLSP